MDFVEIFGRMWKRPQSKELGSSDEGPTDAGRNQDPPKDAQVISEPSARTTTSELATLLRSEFAKMKPVKLPPLSMVTQGPVQARDEKDGAGLVSNVGLIGTMAPVKIV